MEKPVSGNVYDDANNTVGSVSGTYIDEYQNSASEQIETRTISISVVDENGNSIGSGQLQYDDYISYNGGGTRTIDLSGNVNDDVNNTVGSVSGSLEDQYGSVETGVPIFAITSYPSSVSGTPSSAMSISITVTNNGDIDGDCTVRIRDHNNNIVAEQTKTITAGGSATYSLQIILPSNAGTYTWTIEAYNITNDTVDDTKSFTVNVVEQVPLFAITSYPSTVSGTPSEIKIISITVENLGNADGDCMIRIKDHNGNVVASDTKTVSAGGSVTYSLSITLPSQTGTYTWTIEAYNTDTGSVDDSETFTVSVVEEGVPETDIMDTVMELFRMCIMAETMKSLRGREPDYTKCMNIYIMGVLISKLQQQQ